MEQTSKIYVAGNTGLVGSSIVRKLQAEGYGNLVFTPYPEYDLRNQQQVMDFFAGERPEYVFLAAARVGGIMANDTYPADFIYDNLMIETNIIHASYVYNVKKLLFLGSSCIYPREAPQPLKEEYLLTGLLEPTNEPYAIAKIAGIKMCDSYARQHGCNFISAMPTNLYGPNDNYDLEKSHVLPALIRKMHLGKCLENGDWEGVRKDLDKRPIGQVDGKATVEEIIGILKTFGINYELRITDYDDNFELRKTNYELNDELRITNEGQQPTTDNQQPTTNNQQPTTNNLQPTTLTLWGTGKVYREFLHVDDLADALLFIMHHFHSPLISDGEMVKWRNGDSVTLSPRYPVTFLNIGTGNDTTIHDIAYMVKEIVGFKGELRWDSAKPDGTYKKQLDVSLLHELGWREKIALKEGIERVYASYVLM